MIWRTHLAFGLLCGLIIIKFFDYGNWFWLFIVLVGSELPDLDSSKSKYSSKFFVFRMISKVFGHRGIMHSGIFGLFLVLAVNLFFGSFYSIGIGVGYFSHLLIDGLNKKGINFLYPFDNLKLKGFIETGGKLENILFYLILFIDIVLFSS